MTQTLLVMALGGALSAALSLTEGHTQFPYCNMAVACEIQDADLVKGWSLKQKAELACVHEDELYSVCIFSD